MYSPSASIILSLRSIARPCASLFAGDRALHEVLERCETPEDGALALKALRTLRRHRAAQQLHSDFTRYTSNLFLDVSRLLCPRPGKHLRSMTPPLRPLYFAAMWLRTSRQRTLHPPHEAAGSCAGRDAPCHVELRQPLGRMANVRPSLSVWVSQRSCFWSPTLRIKQPLN